MIVIKFNTAVVEIFSDSTRVTLPDGRVILGMAEDTDAYRATAQRFGYGIDTTKLNIDHELMHIALADWLDIASPVMEDVGSGIDVSPHKDLEERAVLAVQEYMRAIGIDPVQLFSRKQSRKL